MRSPGRCSCRRCRRQGRRRRRRRRCQGRTYITISTTSMPRFSACLEESRLTVHRSLLHPTCSPSAACISLLPTAHFPFLSSNFYLSLTLCCFFLIPPTPHHGAVLRATSSSVPAILEIRTIWWASDGVWTKRSPEKRGGGEAAASWGGCQQRGSLPLPCVFWCSDRGSTRRQQACTGSTQRLRPRTWVPAQGCVPLSLLGAAAVASAARLRATKW